MHPCATHVHTPCSYPMTTQDAVHVVRRRAKPGALQGAMALRGASVAGLSRASGVSRPTITALLDGSSTGERLAHKWDALADALGLPVDMLTESLVVVRDTRTRGVA